MKLDNLKKGFFGYQKASVYQYITSIEEDFSIKLMEKDELLQNNEEQYHQRINQLEQQLQDITQKYESQKRQQMMIADTLLEAKQYAETLKKDAEEKQNQERKQWEQELDENHRQLDQYQAEIVNIREMFQQLLLSMDQRTKQLDEQIKMVISNAPDRNMSLFERKVDTDKE